MRPSGGAVHAGSLPGPETGASHRKRNWRGSEGICQHCRLLRSSSSLATWALEPLLSPGQLIRGRCGAKRFGTLAGWRYHAGLFCGVVFLVSWSLLGYCQDCQVTPHGISTSPLLHFEIPQSSALTIVGNLMPGIVALAMVFPVPEEHTSPSFSLSFEFLDAQGCCTFLPFSFPVIVAFLDATRPSGAELRHLREPQDR